MSLTPDNKLCVFEYNRDWLVDGFSISPLELPLKKGIFIAKSTPFYGDFGVFEDSKLVNNKYFTTKRFDITETGERIHVVTAGGLLCIPLSEPVLDYSNLLALTGFLTQNPKDVEEMFRRMVFNYLTGNKDDHCKNFSFSCRKNKDGKWQWRLAPAYDLTLCTAGYNGEHATSVNNLGNPTYEDMVTVGVRTKMREKRCLEIIEEVRSNSSFAF